VLNSKALARQALIQVAALVGSGYQSSWHPYDNRTGINGLTHNGSGANNGCVTDDHALQNRGPGAYVRIGPNFHPTSQSSACSYVNVVPDVAFVLDDRPGIDDYVRSDRRFCVHGAECHESASRSDLGRGRAIRPRMPNLNWSKSMAQAQLKYASTRQIVARSTNTDREGGQASRAQFG